MRGSVRSLHYKYEIPQSSSKKALFELLKLSIIFNRHNFTINLISFQRVAFQICRRPTDTLHTKNILNEFQIVVAILTLSTSQSLKLK